MNLLNNVKRLFISEKGTTKIEYLVMVGCIIILCVTVFWVVGLLQS